MSERIFYITTPIYYVNATPHLGHAYTTILADTLARFYRLNDYEVFFLTGTDEHGDKIQRTAAKENVNPKDYVDRIASIFKETWLEMGITFDNFIRTTDEYHSNVVCDILKRVYHNNDIYFSEFGGYYCTGCERFYTEKEWVMISEERFCPDHKTKLEYIKEENYFFKMEKYRPWLLDYINNNPEFIRPERYKNEILAYLKEPIGDLCISRPKSRLNWGITLPFDKNYVTYVWFDALINYISGLGTAGDNYKKFWGYAEHLIAKDILKPHAVFWPIMLKSAGLPLYKKLNVHGYWMMATSKMSKSLDNVVRPLEMGEKYSKDAFRYFLLREMGFGLDADFKEENLINRLNSDLADDLGNLFSRSISMVHKYFEGVIPSDNFSYTDDDKIVIDEMNILYERVFNSMKNFYTNKALEEIWKCIKLLNQYIDHQAPWNLYKKDAIERLKTVLYIVVDSLRRLAILLQPFIPESAERMLDCLAEEKVKDVSMKDNLLFGKLKKGKKLKESIILFKKVKI
ncbi:MAG: methionine--tRNA ligase [Candidatus Hydrogenedentota bacterium]